MAIEHSIWLIGDHPTKVSYAKLDSESLLEDQLAKDISILSDGWLLIGRQVKTEHLGFIDLLAIDADGTLIIIELKRHQTPREVVAQALDYASWVRTLDSSRISALYADFAAKSGLLQQNFDAAFDARFQKFPSEDELNNSHLIVIVAAELDASTERIIQYLNDVHGVPVNAVFFRVFEDAGNRYLSRAWMIDPGETQDNAATKGVKGPWNGEFYGSFGASSKFYNWNDARTYNFLCAGGGRWHSKTLFMLEPGNRIWVNVPKVGYVGVCHVLESACSADEFLKPDMLLKGNYRRISEYGEDDADYFVRVQWLKAFDEKDAVSEVGLFGNQNSVARPRTPKWEHTVRRLKEIWKLA